MLKILKPILLTFLSSSAGKDLIISLLKEICKKSSNDLDNKAVEFLEQQLFPNRKISSLPR